MADKLDEDVKNLSPEDLKRARQKVMEMLNSENLTDDIKNNLRALLGAKKPFLGDMDSFTAMVVGMAFASLVFSVMLFFGYKLYKSIKEKEKKREEKKKAKQMKKKK